MNFIEQKTVMKKVLGVFVLFFLLSLYFYGQKPLARFNKNTAFTFGEKITLKIWYTLYINIPVGEMTVEVKPEPRMLRNKPHYHLYGSGVSYKFYDAFYKVRDYYESYVDISNFEPLVSVRQINEGSYKSREHYVFNQRNNTVKNKDGKIIPTGDFSQDVLSAIYLARTFDYKNAKFGDSFMINMFIDNSCYYVGVVYEGKEILKLKSGTYRSLILKPILIVDRVFKSDEDMTLWVSDDENKIPLKLHTGISVGALRAELSEYSGLRNTFTAKLK